MPDAPSAYDPRWKELRLPELLRALNDYAEDECLKDEQEYEGSKLALNRAVALRKTLFTRKASSNNSDGATANTFFKEAAGSMSTLLARLNLVGKSQEYPDAAHQVRLILKRNRRVESGLKAWESSFRLLLPDLVEMDEKRWPGHVSYRAGLSHFVAVCLRAHSILPEVSFDAITLSAARRILVPALAHNFKFFAKDHPELYRKFVYDLDVELKPFYVLRNEDGATLPGPSRPVYRKWVRLFNACNHFGEKWGEQKLRGLCKEFQGLLQDHEKDPRNSRLWRDLSILAAGDMAVDEILVSWVIKDVGGEEASLSSSPLVNCARSRFGLLRYAYMMTKEAEAFRADFDQGVSEAGQLLEKIRQSKDGELGVDVVGQAFGWAYLLSRNNLLGRKIPGVEAELRHPDKAGIMLYDLLNELRFKARDEAHRTLALRYLLGFMTNPRFIKPYAKIRDNPKDRKSAYTSSTAEGLITDAAKLPMMPKSIIHLASARIALHHAFLDKNKEATNLRSCLGHYAKIIKELDSPSRDGVMDSEVIAWAIPEMYCAIQSFVAHDPESQADLALAKEALHVFGEIQFGVFFNPNEESERIKRGLGEALGCKIA
jgi:hypothetical protein